MAVMAATVAMAVLVVLVEMAVSVAWCPLGLGVLKTGVLVETVVSVVTVVAPVAVRVATLLRYMPLV